MVDKINGSPVELTLMSPDRSISVVTDGSVDIPGISVDPLKEGTDSPSLGLMLILSIESVTVDAGTLSKILGTELVWKPNV